MGGWRSKIIFLLVVYFAGFATAVYCLAPVSDKAYVPANKGLTHSTTRSDDFVKSFNVGMRKCLDYSKDAARRAGTYLKQKLDDRHS